MFWCVSSVGYSSGIGLMAFRVVRVRVSRWSIALFRASF